MANRTTFTGIVRSNGGDNKRETYAGSMLMAAQFYFDPTAAQGTDVQVSSTDTRKVVLPENSVITGITFNGDATGGTNPTVDIGTSADDDGLFNEVDADGTGTLKGADGALAVAGGLAADATVTGKVGSSAATGGTFTGILTYAMANNGVE